ncbi:MAG: endolytic transglycosylase MltG [Lactobacillus sp.]|jgi:UPF0755 protein|nr:endolytic transglycosylase MltG [Lactobacillus sp.]
MLKKIVVLFVFLIFFALLGVYTFDKQTTSFGPSRETTSVIIPKGAGSRIVANKLTEAGVVSSPLFFRILARIKGVDTQLKAGEYEFPARISMIDALNKMASGDVVYHRITLPEGKTSRQFLDLIDAHPLLSGEIGVYADEGEMLPETYSFTRDTPKDEVVRQAKEAMDKIAKRAWENREDGLPLKNIKQMIVLASIIEKETSVPSERGLVASVFVNRLIKGMRLQTDPTVIYAITNGEAELGRALTRKDLKFDSPYNTYLYYGLPPGPICNPSRESIMKAVNPDFSDYLYFVADGTGGHAFSRSLNEHNRRVSEWRKIRSTAN